VRHREHHCVSRHCACRQPHPRRSSPACHDAWTASSRPVGMPCVGKLGVKISVGWKRLLPAGEQRGGEGGADRRAQLAGRRAVASVVHTERVESKGARSALSTRCPRPRGCGQDPHGQASGRSATPPMLGSVILRQGNSNDESMTKRRYESPGQPCSHPLVIPPGHLQHPHKRRLSIEQAFASGRRDQVGGVVDVEPGPSTRTLGQFLQATSYGSPQLVA